MALPIPTNFDIKTFITKPPPVGIPTGTISGTATTVSPMKTGAQGAPLLAALGLLTAGVTIPFTAVPSLISGAAGTAAGAAGTVASGAGTAVPTGVLAAAKTGSILKLGLVAGGGALLASLLSGQRQEQTITPTQLAAPQEAAPQDTNQDIINRSFQITHTYSPVTTITKTTSDVTTNYEVISYGGGAATAGGVSSGVAPLISVVPTIVPTTELGIGQVSTQLQELIQALKQKTDATATQEGGMNWLLLGAIAIVAFILFKKRK